MNLPVGSPLALLAPHPVPQHQWFPILEHKDELLDALNIFNQRSHNFYGEQIIRVMAQQLGQIGSIQQGVQAVTIGLERLGHDLETITLLDGSGLELWQSIQRRRCQSTVTIDSSCVFWSSVLSNP